MCGTWEAVVPMLREKFKWRTHKNESTDAEHSDGPPRSSDEGPVMGLEQRGRVILPNVMTNQKMGGVFGKGKVVPNF